MGLSAMKPIYVFTSVLLLVCMPCVSQDAGSAPKAEPPGEVPPATNDMGGNLTLQNPALSNATPEVQPKINNKGDKIIFKNGSILDQIQVLRRTPLVYEVEVIEGTEPLRLPVKVIQSVEYDDIDLLRMRRRGESIVKGGRPTMPGQEYSPGLKQSLDIKLEPSPELVFKDADFVKVLSVLAQKVKVIMEFSPQVLALPQDQRVWSLKVNMGSTLFSILWEELPKKFKNIEVLSRYDKLFVDIKSIAPIPMQPIPQPVRGPAQ